MKWMTGARMASLVMVTIGMIGMFSQPAVAVEYIVKYRSSALFADMESPNVAMLEQYEVGRLLKIDMRRSEQLNELLKLYSNPNVEYVVPNVRVHAFMESSQVTTMALKSQWHIAKVQAEKAWARAGNRGSKKVIVAIIDTGADYRHNSLSPNMVQGYDFSAMDSDPMDETGYYNEGHGTHCAGMVGATGRFDGGTIGLSPEVSIMPLRLLDKNGGGDILEGAKAIDYAIAKGASVISASWGARVSRSYARPLIEAIERAGAAGIPFVVAAANDGRDNDKAEYYPTNANTDNTIAVAATSRYDSRASFSNYGKGKVHVGAPGEDIVSTIPGNRYTEMSGTSMATPLVAGIVAFLRAQDPTLTPLQLRSLLQASGDQIGIDVACNCRVNAFTAVDMLLSKKMFVSPYGASIPKGESKAFKAVFGQAPFVYSSSNASVGTIDKNGLLKANSEGETVVTIKDATGQSASTFKIYVTKATSALPGNGGGQAADNPVSCPIDDEASCEYLCYVYPDLPYCI